MGWDFKQLSALPTKLFDYLRDLALSQQVIQPDTNERSAVDNVKLTYSFLGERVCRGAVATLMGVGWTPRLSTLLKSVLKGDRAAPVDVRYQTRPFNDPRPVFSEVYSYLENLYLSVAETLPLDERRNQKPGAGVWSDDEDSYSITPKEGEELRYLPPGTVFDLWRQYNATSGSKASWHCFFQCWKEQFSHKLCFRDRYVFSVCPVCVQHKLLLRGMGADSRACLRQRYLYDRHLAQQFEDRKCYWSLRSQSRLKQKVICLVCDGMDQGKYACPRSKLFECHHFDKYSRPRLHVWGLLCHGYAAILSVSDADMSKGGSTTAELLLFTLSLLKRHGLQIGEYEIVVQLDNTTSSNKNNTLSLLSGVLTQKKLVRAMRLSFLRTGHTHEDLIWALVVPFSHR